MGVKKYFIAIIIPGPLFDELEVLKKDLFQRYGLKGALRSPAHITLHRPFEWKEEREEQLIATLNRFLFAGPFEIGIKDFAFFEPRVIYAGVEPNEQLFDLHRQLKRFAATRLGLLNEVNDARGFHPHVTVAFRDLKKPRFYELKKEFEQHRLSGSFPCQGFSLLKLHTRWEEQSFHSIKSTLQ